MTKNFSDFNLELLLESILEVSPEFYELLSLVNTSSGIEDTIKGWIDAKTDVTTNYNLLDKGNLNDKIFHLQDSQYQRFVQSGQDLSTKTKTETNIGRFVRNILSSNEVKFTEQQIEEFANAYKAAWNRKYAPKEFSIVKGEMIKFWYLESNYYHGGTSTLGNSCMRHERKNPWLSIYTENPDKVSLMILTDYPDDDKDRKLVARALIWKTDDGGIYCDRIYYNAPDIHIECQKWLKAKYPDAYFYGESHGAIKVTLKNVEYKNYPYVDSLYYLTIPLDSNDKLDYSGGGVLMEEVPYRMKSDSYRGVTFTLRDHMGGNWSPQYHKYFEQMDRWIHKSQIWDVYPDGTMPSILCDWSDLYQKGIDKNYSIWSDHHSSFIYNPHSINIEGLGVVDKNYVVLVFGRYLGDNGDYPWIKWNNCKNNNDLLSSEILPKWKSGTRKYFSPEYVSTVWLVKTYPEQWSVSNSARNAEGNRVPGLFCVPVYEIDTKQVKTELFKRYPNDLGGFNWIWSLFLNFIYTNKKNSTFILEEDAEIFDITRYLGKETYLSPDLYRSIGKYTSSEFLTQMVEQTQGLTPYQKKYRIDLDRWNKESSGTPRIIFDSPYDETRGLNVLAKDYLKITKKFTKDVLSTKINLMDFVLGYLRRERPEQLLRKFNMPVERILDFVEKNPKLLEQTFYWFACLYTGNTDTTMNIILQELEYTNNNIVPDKEKSKLMIGIFAKPWRGEPKIRDFTSDIRGGDVFNTMQNGYELKDFSRSTSKIIWVLNQKF